jgi:hypothetical protein
LPRACAKNFFGNESVHIPNPITRVSCLFFPECSAFAARTISTSRSSIACVIFHFAGSASTLPSDIQRYLRAALTVDADGGNSTAQKFSLALVF